MSCNRRTLVVHSHSCCVDAILTAPLNKRNLRNPCAQSQILLRSMGHVVVRLAQGFKRPSYGKLEKRTKICEVQLMNEASPKAKYGGRRGSVVDSFTSSCSPNQKAEHRQADAKTSEDIWRAKCSMRAQLLVSRQTLFTLRPQLLFRVA